MEMNEESAERLTWVVVAGSLALLLMAVLLQLLSHPQVSAQQVEEVLAPNLSVVKAVNAAQAAPGELLTYTVRVRNTGEGVAVWMTDEIPSGVTYVDGSLQLFGPGSADYSAGRIAWSYGNFGWEQTAVITFNVQVSPGAGYTYIVNTAQVTGTGDLIESSVQTQVLPPGMEASKSVYPSAVRPGGTLVYKVSVANTGETSLDAIWMTDELPAEVSYVPGSMTATVGSFDEAGGVVTWNATAQPDGPLPPQAEAAISFAVEVSPALAENIRFTNTAEITGVGALVPVHASATTAAAYIMYFPRLLKYWPPVPYPPVLHDLTNPAEGINDYTVSWTYDHSNIPVITYTLQEATNADFTDAVEYVVPYTGVDDQKQFTDKPDGTYYYRVQGHNEYGAGGWSSVDSIRIFTSYFDDFSNSTSGWPNQRGDIIDDRGVDNGDWYRRYLNGQYQIMIGEASCWTCYWFLQPNALAPYRPTTDKYCVETKARFEESGWWANMGLIFGANEANTKLYSLCLSRGGDPEKLGWFLMMKDDYEFPKRGCSGPTEKIDGSDFDGTHRDDWNRLQVGVDGNKVKVWIGGLYKGQYTMNGLAAMTRVGLIGGVYEILTVDTRFDNFRVTPNADCQP